MNDIIPCFSSHYSLAKSILTLDERPAPKPDKPRSVNGPRSIIDLAFEAALSEVFLVESKIDGFLEAYKNLSKVKIPLRFGVKMVVCADHADKSDTSLKTESKVIIFIRNNAGYNDLIKLYNRAWTDNFYYVGRTSWAQLKEFWTPNLLLALPFFSSFAAKNSLTFQTIIPDFPIPPVIFREVHSGLPFEPLIHTALDNFNADKKLKEQRVKTIYYANRSSFKAYCVFRAIHNRTTFSRPEVEHLASDRFSFEDYLALQGVV
jgi:DNA polymerase III alpha subunit